MPSTIIHFPISTSILSIILLQWSLILPGSPVDSANPQRRLRMKRGVVSTNSDISEILSIANSLRSSQSATNMNQLTYNQALATASLKWATECNFEHGGLVVTGFSAEVGQNIYLSLNVPVNITGIFMAWYDEKNFYNSVTGACSIPICGHYTELVWATNSQIGCAYNYCQSVLINNERKATNVQSGYFIFICDFAPGGNVKGIFQPYIAATNANPVCSACKFCDNYSKLCTLTNTSVISTTTVPVPTSPTSPTVASSTSTQFLLSDHPEAGSGLLVFFLASIVVSIVFTFVTN